MKKNVNAKDLAGLLNHKMSGFDWKNQSGFSFVAEKEIKT